MNLPVKNDAAPLKKTGFGIVHFQSRENSFGQPFHLVENQIRVYGDNSLGPADIVLNGNTSLFCEEKTSADVAAKIVQGRTSSGYAIVGTIGSSDTLTIRNVGAKDDNTTRSFGFGRSAGGTSTATLAITNSASEGIGSYGVRGRFYLTLDGGTVKAASVAGDALFNALDDYWSKALLVSENGVTFDTNGAYTDLGAALAYTNAGTTAPASAALDGGDFEDGKTGAAPDGWAIERTGNSGVSSLVAVNGGDFVPEASKAYYTTDGNKFFVLRASHSATHSFFLPTAGRWRVSFMRGCRPSTGYPSYPLALTVTVDGDANLSTAWDGEDEIYTFRNDKTDAFLLAAGEHTVTFAVGPKTKDNSQAVFLDAISFERDENEDGASGVIAKTGDGTLALTRLPESAKAVVSGGTLLVRKAEVDGASLSVYPGGTLAFAGAALTDSSVSVAAGGTLEIRTGDGDNLVANGSFEANALSVSGAGASSYRAGNPTGWTTEYLGTSTDTTKASGIQRDGGLITANGPRVPYGMVTAYIRESTTYSQTVTVPSDGDYRVSFAQASRIRSGVASYEIPLSLSIDGKAVVENGAKTANYGFFTSAADVALAAGEHELVFRTGEFTSGTDPISAMLFIDDVRLESLAPANDLSGATFALSSGSTVRLDNAKRLKLRAGSVTVDGRTVDGDRRALAKAGVTVEGDGEIAIGNVIGFRVVIR